MIGEKLLEGDTVAVHLAGGSKREERHSSIPLGRYTAAVPDIDGGYIAEECKL